MSSLPSPPPYKRRRQVDHQNTSDSTIERSSRFWFDDGNVILQAENTQFRVHRSLLVLHSETMKESFSVLEKKDTKPVGDPSIVNMPDSAKDIENMCTLFYGLYHFDNANTDFSYVKTMIRLGKKYKISYFKTKALTLLQALFPQSLLAWDRKQAAIASVLKDGNKLFLFDIINFAYECRIMSILPAAFLSLCTSHDLEEILQKDPGSTTSRTVLERQPLLDCIRGRTFMHSFLVDIVSRFRSEDPANAQRVYDLPFKDCRKSICSKSVQQLIGDLIICGIAVGKEKISFTNNTKKGLPDAVQSLCEDCKKAFEKEFGKCRSRLWNELPEYFNLPSWERIRDFDAEHEEAH